MLVLAPVVAALVPLVIRVLRGDPDGRLAEGAGLLVSETGTGALLRTLRVAGAAAGICLIVGVPAAMVLARVAVPGRTAWRAALLTGLLLPPYFSAVAWTGLLGFEGSLTRAVWGPDATTAPLYGEAGLVLVLVTALLPVVPAVLVPALQRTDAAAEETLRMVTGPWRAAVRATLPAVRAEVAGAGLLVFCLAAGGAAATDLLPVPRLYGSWIFAGFVGFGFDAATAAMLLLPLPAAVVPVGVWLASRRSGTHAGRAGGGAMQVRAPADVPTGRWGRVLATAVVAVAAMAGTGVPLLVILARLVPAGGGLADVWGSHLEGWRRCGPVLWDTAMAVVPAAVTAAWLAPRAAEVLHQSQRRAWWWAGLVVVPILVPSPLAAAGLSSLKNDLPGLAGLLRGEGLISRVAGHALLPAALLMRFLPAAIAVAAAARARVDRSATDAAAAAGLSPAEVRRVVVRPALAGASAAGGLLVGLLALGEIEIVVQLAPPGRRMLSELVYEQAHRNLEHDLAGLCSVMVVLAAGAATAVALWARVRGGGAASGGMRR